MKLRATDFCFYGSLSIILFGMVYWILCPDNKMELEIGAIYGLIGTALFFSTIRLKLLDEIDDLKKKMEAVEK